MDKRNRTLHLIGLSLAVLLLLSCQLFSSLMPGQDGVQASPSAATSAAASPDVAFTLVDAGATPDGTATWAPTWTPTLAQTEIISGALTETLLPGPLSPTGTLTLSPDAQFSGTPTSLATTTLATTLTPAPTFTLGTPLPSDTPSPTQTPFPTATIFSLPTATQSGPLIINLNGSWTGYRRFDAKCGGCDSTIANRLAWTIYQYTNGVVVGVGLDGGINGTVLTLSGTEKYLGGGWVKLNYIITLQPDGNTLIGRFWGEGRLPSPCFEELKLRSCNIANGTIRLER